MPPAGARTGRAPTLRTRYAAFLRPDQTGPHRRARQPVAEDCVAASATAGPAGDDAGQQRPVEAPRSVRVDIAHLDNPLNLVGELVINRTSQEQHLERLGRTVAEILLSVDRLRRVGFQLESRYEVAELLRSEGWPLEDEGITRPRPLAIVGGTATRGEDEFDSLEMDRYTELHRISRELVEIAADINAAGTELDVLHDNFDQTLSRQSRIATDLQDRMMEVRLVPLSTIAARLYRAVRGVANRRGRPTELVIAGETVEIDKVLLEEITDPLLHLVRNAVDHGVESPEERAARGKPATATVSLIAAREGNEAVIRVSDDGGGIDLDRVLDKAVARGVVRRREGLTREQIMDLIFLPGFSTSATISDISGRGVGLDVVRTNVTRLKGMIDVDSTVGVGTTFTIRLPIMLAVTRALLVRSGAQTFAIPLPVVDQVAFFRKDPVTNLGGNELFDLGGEAYPVLYLGRALGLAGEVDLALHGARPPRRERRAAGRAGGGRTGWPAGSRRQALGRHLQSVAGVAGATILGSGQVVLILNVLDLIRQPPRGARRPAADSAGGGAAGERRARGDGRGRLAERAPGADPDAGARRLAGARREGWRRGAGDAGLGQAAGDGARHRDATHGRLRVDQSDPQPPGPPRAADCDADLARGREAPAQGTRPGGVGLPGQALRGGRTAADRPRVERGGAEPGRELGPGRAPWSGRHRRPRWPSTWVPPPAGRGH